jgi:hypothetical protein
LAELKDGVHYCRMYLPASTTASKPVSQSVELSIQRNEQKGHWVLNCSKLHIRDQVFYRKEDTQVARRRAVFYVTSEIKNGVDLLQDYLSKFR